MSGIVIVHAGLRVPSSTKLLADGFAAAFASDNVGVVAQRDPAHAIPDAVLTGHVTAPQAEALATGTGADALVAVTPTFSASFSGLFKSFFDILEPGALQGMPTLLAATGGSARHSLVIDFAMRPLLSYLGAQVVRTGVFAATEDFGGSGAAALQRRIEEAAGELRGCLTGPERRRATDAFEEVTPFEQLLNRGGSTS
ncbi:MAG: NAD(P)H-dependent oxidoreductase [Propionibacteriaceae bacterium]|nr:NAD(P)H-dependent oxidoreductase [Propionibacteriaceae bacterium]